MLKTNLKINSKNQCQEEILKFLINFTLKTHQKVQQR